MDVQQAIYLDIVAMLGKQGIRLALPAQTVHLGEVASRPALDLVPEDTRAAA